MSELVKQGIQEASKGLQQENEEKILQEVSFWVQCSVEDLFSVTVKLAFLQASLSI